VDPRLPSSLELLGCSVGRGCSSGLKCAEYEENAESMKLAILYWLNSTRVEPRKTCDDYDGAERAAVSE
jgi:hypothetical protein